MQKAKMSLEDFIKSKTIKLRTGYEKLYKDLKEICTTKPDWEPCLKCMKNGLSEQNTWEDYVFIVQYFLQKLPRELKRMDSFLHYLVVVEHIIY